jgi:hypothetical protein
MTNGRQKRGKWLKILTTGKAMSDKLIPNSFQCPNSYIDDIGYLLTDGEFKTLLYVIRHVFGWQDKISRRRARISLSKIAKGFKTSDGNTYRGSGQSEQTVSSCLHSLAEFGVIKQTSSNNAKNEGAEWEICCYGDIKFDALLKRKDSKTEQAKARSNESMAAARTAARKERTQNHSTASNGGVPQNGSTATGRAVLGQVVEPFYTTNPIKPNSNPNGANAPPYQNHEVFCIPSQNKNARLIANAQCTEREREILTAFIELSGIQLTTATLKTNLFAARQIVESGATVADVREAYADSKRGNNGFTVTDLWSLSKVAAAKAGTRRRNEKPSVIYEPVFN